MKNKINSVVTIHEDNKGVFYKLHLERSKENPAPHNSGGLAECYDIKPSFNLIQQRANWLNHDQPCDVIHEFETV